MYSETLPEIAERLRKGAENAQGERDRSSHTVAFNDDWWSHLTDGERAAYFDGRLRSYSHAADLVERLIESQRPEIDRVRDFVNEHWSGAYHTNFDTERADGWRFYKTTLHVPGGPIAWTAVKPDGDIVCQTRHD